MNQNYNNILMNLPVRHILDKIETEEEKLEQQINKFVNLNIMNFFILSRLYDRKGSNLMVSFSY